MVAELATPQLLFNEDTRFYRTPSPLPPESPLPELSPTPDWDKRYPFIALLDGTIPQFSPKHTETPAASIIWLPEENQQSPSLLLPSSGEDESDNTPVLSTPSTAASSVNAASTNALPVMTATVTSGGSSPSPKNVAPKKQHQAKTPDLPIAKSQAKVEKKLTSSSPPISEDDSDNIPLEAAVKSAPEKSQLVKAPNPSQTLVTSKKLRSEDTSNRKPSFPQSRVSEQSQVIQKVRTIPRQQAKLQNPQNKNSHTRNEKESFDPHRRAKQPSQLTDRKLGKYLPSTSSIMRKRVAMGKKPKAYDRPKPVARQAQGNWARALPPLTSKSQNTYEYKANNKNYNNKKNIGPTKRNPRIRPSQLGKSKSQGLMHQVAKRKAAVNSRSTFEPGPNSTSQVQGQLLEHGPFEGPNDCSNPVLSNSLVNKTNKKRSRRPSCLPTSQPRKRFQLTKQRHFSNTRRPNNPQKNLQKPGMESNHSRRMQKNRLPSLVEMCQRVIKVNRETVLLTRPIGMHLSKRTIKTILNSFGLRHHETLCQIAELNPRWRKVMEPLWEKVCDTTYPQFKSKKPEGMTFFDFYKKWAKHRKRAKLKAVIAMKGHKADHAVTRKVNVLTIQETKKMFPKKKRRRKC